ncbi:hypothetical protein PMI36_05821 [Pseudomonas sp. GM79]|nr:hypothetical protein PMI36_05821 [Pseudomonas sp. GM79]
MDRYMPVTGIDCTIASLLIDTEAPLDVLHETAAYRIRTATQLLESFAVNCERRRSQRAGAGVGDFAARWLRFAGCGWAKVTDAGFGAVTNPA